MIKRAMILAAGFGKRVHPLTANCPKPLLKIGKETLLSNTIKFLEKFGINEIVINVHYLKEQIINYINIKKFNPNIKIIIEKNNILNTGGGILNAIENFSNDPFLVINPDTIWNLNYLKELQLMENIYLSNKKNKCLMLVVDKEKSFDKNFMGDFNLEKDLINRNNNLKYIYTGLQILNPEAFSSFSKEAFSINKVWDQLIDSSELYGLKSDINFLHISTYDIYKKLLKKNFKF